MGRLGRHRVAPLVVDGVELPSDFHGVGSPRWTLQERGSTRWRGSSGSGVSSRHERDPMTDISSVLKFGAEAHMRALHFDGLVHMRRPEQYRAASGPIPVRDDEWEGFDLRSASPAGPTSRSTDDDLSWLHRRSCSRVAPAAPHLLCACNSCRPCTSTNRFWRRSSR